MLRSPRPLPPRFRRPFTDSTRRVVSNRLRKRRLYQWKRMQRMLLSWRQRLSSLRAYALPGLAIAAVITFCGLFAVFAFSPIFTVRSIRVAQTDDRISAQLIALALKPLFHRHLLFLSHSDVTPLLTASLPDLHRSAAPDAAAVIVSKDYPHTLRVAVSLLPIAYRLTIADPAGAPIAASGSSIVPFLTDTGLYVSYPAAAVASGSTLPQVTVRDWGVRPNPWLTLLDPSLMHLLDDSTRVLQKEFGATIKERVVYLRAREVHLTIGTITLWLDLRSTIEEQMERYRIFLGQKKAKASQYIDLRVQDRIIYR